MTRHTARLALFLGAALAAASPAIAFAQTGGASSGDSRINYSEPGPKQAIESALQKLHAGDMAAARDRLEQAQNRLEQDSNAANVGEARRTAMLRAIPLLNQASRALHRGDKTAATTAMNSAQALL